MERARSSGLNQKDDIGMTMLSSVKKVLPVLLICVCLVPVRSARTATETAQQKRPSAWELLHRYAEQQAKIAAPQSKERVVHFPEDKSIGRCFLVEPQPEQTCLWHRVLVWPKTDVGHIRGDVTVPTGRILRLDVWDSGPKAHEALANLGPDDVQILNFYQCKKADDRMLSAASRLTGLKVLFLGQGRFTLKGLKHLVAFRELRALQLPGDVPVESLELIRKLTSLRYLSIGGPELTDVKMAKVGQLPWLTQLNIGGSKVGKGLAHLKGFKSLWFLSLAAMRNEHIDKHLAHLAELTTIEELNLSDTLVGDAGLEHLTGMIKLKKLDLGNRYYPVSDKITDAGMVHLNNLKSLEELKLAYDGVTDIGLSQLAGLNALKKLNVGRGVTDEGMASLAKMKSLEDLDISSRHVTDAGMEKLAQCPHLKFLNLGRCPVTDRGLARLAKLKTLTKLSLRRTQVTGSGLTVLKELPLLTEVNVHYIDFGEAGMAHLAGLKSLERLWIDGPEGKITDDDLADLSRVTSLKNLHISVRDSSQSLITNQGLVHLANLKALESLNIHSCQKVTDAGLRHFEGLACLKRLRLDFSRITKAGIARLKAKIPGVDVIVQRAVPRRNAGSELQNRPTRTMQRRSGRNEAKTREGR
ncbi:MAG: leucine-rich repeat domain-containing protein [Planctomycetota bacterium]|jgi:Leucine-rich repeat (LRR) protein